MLKLIICHGTFDFLHERERLTIFRTSGGWGGKINEGAESLPEDEDCTLKELFLHISPRKFWEIVDQAVKDDSRGK